MAFMKRDVNFSLLILIIVSILVFSGFSVYYQSTFKNISLDYKNKLEELGQVTSDLAVQKKELNETYTQRVKAEEDRKVLDVRFRDVSSENEQLNDDNSNLRTEVSNVKNDLAEKSAELSATINLLAKTQSDLIKTKSVRDRYKKDLEEVCDDYTTATGQEHEEC